MTLYAKHCSARTFKHKMILFVLTSTDCNFACVYCTKFILFKGHLSSSNNEGYTSIKKLVHFWSGPENTKHSKSNHIRDACCFLVRYILHTLSCPCIFRTSINGLSIHMLPHYNVNTHFVYGVKRSHMHTLRQGQQA